MLHVTEASCLAGILFWERALSRLRSKLSIFFSGAVSKLSFKSQRNLKTLGLAGKCLCDDNQVWYRKKKKFWELSTNLQSLLNIKLNHLNHIYHQFVFLQLGTAGTVPLKRLGQEEEFAQRPLYPQLKHLSAVWSWRPRKDCTGKKGWLEEKELSMDDPAERASLILGWLVVGLDTYLHIFRPVQPAGLLSAKRINLLR